MLICFSEEIGVENDELKYMYAIIQVFSNDGMDSLKSVLLVIMFVKCKICLWKIK